MKKTLLMLIAILFTGTMANATPSTQIWVPSTDIQPYKSLHLNIDNYIAQSNKNNLTRKSPQFVLGPTIGILPYKKIQAETGFDIIQSGDAALDNYPLYFHLKIGTQENAFYDDTPAMAVGIYNVGTKSDRTNQNILYILAAKNFRMGRFSAGYYDGNDKILVDKNGKKADNGVLLSWDRTMTEISDKLWVAVDYQGGNSSMGALNLGFSWSLSKNNSLILGYDIYNNPSAAGANTFTVQFDANLF